MSGLLSTCLTFLALAGAARADGDATVHFTATEPDVPVSLVRGTSMGHVGTTTVITTFHEELCLTPCSVRLPEGSHEFLVLSTGWGGYAGAREGFILRAGEHHIDIHTGKWLLKALGSTLFITGGTSLVTAVVLLTSGMRGPKTYSATIGSAAGVVAGVPLFFRHRTRIKKSAAPTVAPSPAPAVASAAPAPAPTPAPAQEPSSGSAVPVPAPAPTQEPSSGSAAASEPAPGEVSNVESPKEQVRISYDELLALTLRQDEEIMGLREARGDADAVGDDAYALDEVLTPLTASAPPPEGIHVNKRGLVVSAIATGTLAAASFGGTVYLRSRFEQYPSEQRRQLSNTSFFASVGLGSVALGITGVAIIF